MKFVFVVCAILAMLLGSVLAVEKSACALSKEVGPCRGSEASFYFNSEAKECQEFLYGGCHGNDNRFESKEACEKLCLADKA